MVREMLRPPWQFPIRGDRGHPVFPSATTPLIQVPMARSGWDADAHPTEHMLATLQLRLPPELLQFHHRESRSTSRQGPRSNPKLASTPLSICPSHRERPSDILGRPSGTVPTFSGRIYALLPECGRFAVVSSAAEGRVASAQGKGSPRRSRDNLASPFH
jgi:hypothetical protein